MPSLVKKMKEDIIRAMATKHCPECFKELPNENFETGEEGYLFIHCLCGWQAGRKKA